jgi:hypothetical protein
MALIAVVFTSGCVSTRVETLTNYTPPPSSSHQPRFDPDAVDEYFFLSWEPYHFFVTLGILPQYHYVVYQKDSGEFEKRSTMIGWIAIPLPLLSPWKYGGFQDDDKTN